MIAEQPIARCLKTQLLGHRADRADKASDQFDRRIRREIGEGDVIALRQNKNVNGRLRVNVVEGQRERILIDFLAGNLATQNLGEYVVAP